MECDPVFWPMHHCITHARGKARLEKIKKTDRQVRKSVVKETKRMEQKMAEFEQQKKDFEAAHGKDAKMPTPGYTKEYKPVDSELGKLPPWRRPAQ